MRIGYIRYNIDSNLTEVEQRKHLQKSGCTSIYSDVDFSDEDTSAASFKNKFLKKPQRTREQLSLALDRLKSGDKLVVTRLDRLGLSIRGLVLMVNRLSAAGIHFQALEEGIDTSDPSGPGGALPKLGISFEKLDGQLSSERTRISRVSRKTQPRLGGRPFKISPKKIEKARVLIDAGTPVRRAAKLIGISQATLYRRIGGKKA